MSILICVASGFAGGVAGSFFAVLWLFKVKGASE